MSEEYLFEYKSIFSPLEVIKLHSKQETHFAQGGTVLVPPNLIGFFFWNTQVNSKNKEIRRYFIDKSNKKW